MPTLELTDTDRELLRIWSRSWVAYPGRMEQVIRERTGLSKFAACQRINRLIDTEAALAFDAVTTNRLRRVRAANRR